MRQTRHKFSCFDDFAKTPRAKAAFKLSLIIFLFFSNGLAWSRLSPAAKKGTLAQTVASEFAIFAEQNEIDMQIATALYWHGWDLPSVCEAITERVLSKLNPKTLAEIEDFLPQLTHILIVSEHDQSYRSLESLLLTAASVSLRLALKLNWILEAAQEDYGPAFSDRSNNPNADASIYARVKKLRSHFYQALTIEDEKTRTAWAPSEGGPDQEAFFQGQFQEVKAAITQALKSKTRKNASTKELQHFLSSTLEGGATLQRFKSALEFVRELTEISERLRLLDRTNRKAALSEFLEKLTIPPATSLPFGKSPGRKVLSSIETKQSRPFSTRMRCPYLVTLMTRDPSIETNQGLLSLFQPISSSSISDDKPEALQFIAKSFDDLRQEAFAMQLLGLFAKIWRKEALDLKLRTYSIIPTARDRGLIEYIGDAESFDSIKGNQAGLPREEQTLLSHFKKKFPDPNALETARDRFTESLAAYSIACYVLGIKDRHNGNLMLATNGEIVHIDFGFIFGQAPGKDKLFRANLSLERAPFKLTSEMAAIIGDQKTQRWKRFVNLVSEGLLALKKNFDLLQPIIEVTSYKSQFPCFNQKSVGSITVVKQLQTRLMLNMDDRAIRRAATGLCNDSLNDYGTILYERFQYATNGINPIY